MYRKCPALPEVEAPFSRPRGLLCTAPHSRRQSCQNRLATSCAVSRPVRGASVRASNSGQRAASFRCQARPRPRAQPWRARTYCKHFQYGEQVSIARTPVRIYTGRTELAIRNTPKGAYCVNFDCSTHLVAESTHYRNFTGITPLNVTILDDPHRHCVLHM